MAKYVYKPNELEGFKITKVRTICQNSEYEITLEDNSTRICNKPLVARMVPVPGDYYVVQKDGYAYLNPRHVFESKCERLPDQPHPMDSCLSFSEALRALKSGYKVARNGWNGKGMYLFHVPENGWTLLFGNTTDIKNGAFIMMKTADTTYVPWLASQTDILAHDWQILN